MITPQNLDYHFKPEFGVVPAAGVGSHNMDLFWEPFQNFEVYRKVSDFEYWLANFLIFHIFALRKT